MRTTAHIPFMDTVFFCLVLMRPVQSSHHDQPLSITVAGRMWSPSKEKQTKKGSRKSKGKTKSTESWEFPAKFRRARERLNTKRLHLAMNDS